MSMTLSMQPFHLAPSSGQANLVFLKRASVRGMPMQLGVAPGISWFFFDTMRVAVSYSQLKTSPVVLKQIWSYYDVTRFQLEDLDLDFIYPFGRTPSGKFKMFHCIGQESLHLLGGWQ